MTAITRIALLLTLLLGGCAEKTVRPDLQRLYVGASVATQPPVVLVHGVLGAKLRAADGTEIWPGGIRKLAFSEYRDLALSIDPQSLRPSADGSVPHALFDQAAGRDFYGAILRTLTAAGGYHAATVGTPPMAGRRAYYVFLYDWRQDNVESAKQLNAFIERIRADLGKPKQRVDLVAHSNGGLVARYFARYGSVDLLDGNEFPVTQIGAAKIRRLILLGTPNFGSLESLKGFIEGTQVGLRRIPPEVLLTMPSAYQLFPHALNAWLIDADGEPLDRDIFDVEIWRRFQWAIFDPTVRERITARATDAAAAAAELTTLERYFAKSLERARRFTWALSVAETGRGVRPIVLGGNCSLTPARLLVEEAGGDSVLRIWPEEIAHPKPGIDYGMHMLEPGDGTVTKASLLARESLDPGQKRNPWVSFPYDYAFFLCERHDRLTSNASFQDNLLHALLSVDR